MTALEIWSGKKKRNCGWDANTTCKKSLILSAPGTWPMIIILTHIFIHNTHTRMSTWYCKIIWDHRFKWSKIGFGSHSSCWLCKVCESHLGAPWDWSNFLGSRPLISNGPWRFECSTSKKKIIQGHLNTGIKTQDFPHWHLWKIGPETKVANGPSSLPIATSYALLFSLWKGQGEREGFLEAAPQLRVTSITSLLDFNMPAVRWETCVTDGRWHNTDSWWPLPESSTCRQASQEYDIRTTSHASPTKWPLGVAPYFNDKSPRGPKPEICIFGWRKADWIFREAWPLGEEARVKQLARVYFRLGWKPATLHSDLGRWNTYCVEGKEPRRSWQDWIALWSDGPVSQDMPETSWRRTEEAKANRVTWWPQP